MTTLTGGRTAAPEIDLIELSIGAGTPLELWLGEDGESRQERAARLRAARDILADAPELFDRVTRMAIEAMGAASELHIAVAGHRLQAVAR